MLGGRPWRADCLALLASRGRRRTHFVRCALCVQTCCAKPELDARVNARAPSRCAAQPLTNRPSAARSAVRLHRGLSAPPGRWAVLVARMKRQRNAGRAWPLEAMIPQTPRTPVSGLRPASRLRPEPGTELSFAEKFQHAEDRRRPQRTLRTKSSLFLTFCDLCEPPRTLRSYSNPSERLLRADSSLPLNNRTEKVKR